MLRSLLIATLLTAAVPYAAMAESIEAGHDVFKSQCSTCHSPVAGKNAVGPSLFGIVGRKSGQVEGFHYSAANKNSNLTWDKDTLDKYLTSPKDVVPKTIMTYAGVKDPVKRANLIAYLETLK